jgi:hypothetical protein
MQLLSLLSLLWLLPLPWLRSLFWLTFYQIKIVGISVTSLLQIVGNRKYGVRGGLQSHKFHTKLIRISPVVQEFKHVDGRRS